MSTSKNSSPGVPDDEDAQTDGVASSAGEGAAAKPGKADRDASGAGVQRAGAKKKPKAAAKKGEPTNVFGKIALFVRQVIAELRKVVTPTRSELGTYIAVVIVFVLIMMAYIGVLDIAIGRVVFWAFGSD